MNYTDVYRALKKGIQNLHDAADTLAENDGNDSEEEALRFEIERAACSVRSLLARLRRICTVRAEDSHPTHCTPVDPSLEPGMLGWCLVHRDWCGQEDEA